MNKKKYTQIKSKNVIVIGSWCSYSSFVVNENHWCVKVLAKLGRYGMEFLDFLTAFGMLFLFHQKGKFTNKNFIYALFSNNTRKGTEVPYRSKILQQLQTGIPAKFLSIAQRD